MFRKVFAAHQGYAMGLFGMSWYVEAHHTVDVATSKIVAARSATSLLLVLQ